MNSRAPSSRRLIGAFASLALVATACGGGNEASPSATDSVDGATTIDSSPSGSTPEDVDPVTQTAPSTVIECCDDGDVEQRDPDQDAPGTASGDVIRYWRLGLHECANDENDEDVLVIDCTEPHTTEVYAIYESQVEDYGEGTDGSGCYPEFLAYTGTPYGESGLFGYHSFADEEDWTAGDRTVKCFAEMPEPTSGTLDQIDFAAGIGDYLPWSSVTEATCIGATSDITDVNVETSDCSNGDLDVLGLIDPADGDLDAQCAALVADAGLEGEPFARSSRLLVRRGFDQSICVLLP